MEKVIYSKCATERKKEYRIITSIIENNGKKLVYKKPMSISAQAHVDHMYEVYTNQLFKNELVKLTPCRKTMENQIVFDFIEGVSLASKLEEVTEEGDWESLFAWVSKLKEIIYSGIECVDFQGSEMFRKFFGDRKEIENLESAINLNIDLIPENIIIRNDEYYVIDYEWVLPFEVPVKYILFRALFFSSVFGRVPKDIRTCILEIVDISPKEWECFLQMERNFQEAVTDSALDVLYQKMKKDVFFTDKQTIALKDINTIVAKDECERELFYSLSRNSYETITFRVIEDGKIRVQLATKPSIIKIQKVAINDVEQKDYITNCNLQIIDDYYFPGKAELELKAQAGDEIVVSYKIFEETKDSILVLSNALKENNVLTLENLELKKWNEAYIEKIDTIGSKLQEAQQELEFIKGTKVWRLYSKIKKR